MTTTPPDADDAPASTPRGSGPLRRRADTILGGVCGGIADRVGMSARVVRVLAVLSLALFGFGLLAYFAAWALIPRDGEEHAPAARVLEDRRQLHIVLAVATVVAAVLLVFQVLGMHQSALVAWPVLLTAIFALCV